MKKLTTIAMVGTVAAVGILALNVNSEIPKIKIGMHGPVRTIAALPTFAEIVAYFRANINPRTILAQSSNELAEKIIQEHQASNAGSGNLAVMNNLGSSDSDYQNKAQLEAMAKEEVIRLAQEMAKSGGGTVAVVAGNTNTGVGRIVTAVQNSEFQKMLWQNYKVRITTWGVSSAQAALSHGPYDAGKYGTDFMNVNLTGSVQIPTDGWTVKVEGVSQVVTLTVALREKAKLMNVKLKNIFVVREGGAIGMGEATQMMIEMKRVAIEEGIDVRSIAQDIQIIMQRGHLSGDSVNEVAADKGPKAVTDIIVSLYQMAKLDAEFRGLIDALKIKLENIDKNGVVNFRGDLNFEALQNTVSILLNSSEGKQLLDQSKIYREKMQSGVDVASIEKEMGILSADDLKAVRNEIKKLTKEAPGSAQLAEQWAIINKHRGAVRVKSFANSVMVVLQEFSDLSKAYEFRANIRVALDATTRQETLVREQLSSASSSLSSMAEDIRSGYTRDLKQGTYAAELARYRELRKELDIIELAKKLNPGVRARLVQLSQSLIGLVTKSASQSGLKVEAGKVSRTIKTDVERAVEAARRR